MILMSSGLLLWYILFMEVMSLLETIYGIMNGYEYVDTSNIMGRMYGPWRHMFGVRDRRHKAGQLLEE